MIKITTTLLVALTTTLTIAFGQNQTATTESGKKVILMPNGSWKYDTVKIVQTKLDPNDCNNWTRIEEDKVAGKSFTVMKEPLVISKDGGKTGFDITLLLTERSIVVSITTSGTVGCIDEGDKINILFTDGTRMELANQSSFNCKGNATIYFGGIFGKKGSLKELKEKKIDTLRVWTRDNYVEEKFTDEQAEQLKNTLICLSK